MKPMDPATLEVSPLELERQQLLTAPAPAVPTWPRLPRLTFFMRLLAARHPDLAGVVAELLSLYAMGWHCAAADDDVRDSTVDFLEFVACHPDSRLDDGGGEGESGEDRLYDFESRFTLFLRDDPRLHARFARPRLHVTLCC